MPLSLAGGRPGEPASPPHWTSPTDGIACRLARGFPEDDMIPIHELLNRIRWDTAFAQGRFVLGYYDRVDDKVIQVPISRVQFTPGDHFAFQVTDADGTTHDVPFHRVKDVYRNGELIWHREH